MKAKTVSPASRQLPTPNRTTISTTSKCRPKRRNRKRFIASAATATLALASIGGLFAYDRVAGLTQVFAAAPQRPPTSQQAAQQTADQLPVGRTKYSEFSMRISDRIGTTSSVAEVQHTVAQLR
ncbi:MAG: hypothetical protein JSU95_11900 [Betaproteobacteria bacterium]|nr:MAG: hypothetical protein JSU95_11900 [Betaproteobacteria bacterium]